MHLSFPDDIIFQFSSIWGTLLWKKPKSVAVDGSVLRHTCGYYSTMSQPLITPPSFTGTTWFQCSICRTLPRRLNQALNECMLFKMAYPKTDCISKGSVC